MTRCVACCGRCATQPRRSGADPLACVIWSNWSEPDADLLPDHELSCYASGSSAPVQVVGPDEMRLSQVALRRDGAAIAWSESAPEGNGRVFVAALDGTTAGEPATWVAYPARPAGGDTFTGMSISDLAFAGDTSQLVVSVDGQSDDGSGLALIDTNESTGSWRPRPPLVSPQEPRVHDTLVSVESATATTAWAVLATDGMYRMDVDVPGDLGVLVSLEDGSVLETLVTPSDGRDVMYVSGHATAIAYVTRPVDEGDGPGERRSYLRRAGEDAGTRLEGLDPTTVRVLLGP